MVLANTLHKPNAYIESKTTTKGKSGTPTAGTAITDQDLRNLYQYSEELQAKFQAIRDRDFARLDEQGCVYLDCTGGMIAPECLLQQHFYDLQTTVLGNPHSENEPSKASAQRDQAARRAVLDFCGASNKNIDNEEEEYTVIWTPNATGALKLVGESYPFQEEGAFLYAPDCHNSVLGIAKYSEAKHATTKGFDFLNESLCYDWDHFTQQVQSLERTAAAAATTTTGRERTSSNLLGIPGKSNASGYTHNIRRYVNYVHSLEGGSWDVLVDAAAMAPTEQIRVKDLGYPEFLCMSFYKIFGHPTGVGCLVAKTGALKKLIKPWFAGGTVELVGVTSNQVIDFLINGDTPNKMSAKFEDGTINYDNLQAVTNGLYYMEQVVGMDDLHKHVQFLSSIIERRLRQLHWPNGNPLVYIPSIISKDETQGNVVCAIFLTPYGTLMSHQTIEHVLCQRGISTRTGCFCNPGTGFQMAYPYMESFGYYSRQELIETFLVSLKERNQPGEFWKANAENGMVRISVGLPTNLADVDALINAIRQDILAHPEKFEQTPQSERKCEAACPFG